MDCPTAKLLRIGDWCVDPMSGQISRQGENVRVEARTMRLLLCLAESAGEVVSVDDLLSRVWSGVIVTPDSVYQSVASLRRVLGDDPKQPTYIATVPRLGYRMVAAVSSWIDQPASTAVSGAASGITGGNFWDMGKPAPGSRRRAGVLLAGVSGLCFALIAALYLNGKVVNNHRAAAMPDVPPKSVAVLPFLDLTTQEMNEEYFADGMTEELIDRLSKIPGLRVPPPTSSFYFKGKRVEVNEIAKALGVAYLLDGSVRKSGATLRVAARLIRANDGYVVWSETYDRPLANELTIQDDIASEVTRALKASIH
jgi:transcriptional activator of cad operon